MGPRQRLSRRVIDTYNDTVAVDFGTTGTGYAYSFLADDENDITCKTPGGQGADKAETVILLNRASLEVLAFGAAAREEYCEQDEDCTDGPLLFECYKMLLKDNTFTVEAVDGTLEPLLEVITKTLEFVRKEAV